MTKQVKIAIAAFGFAVLLVFGILIYIVVTIQAGAPRWLDDIETNNIFGDDKMSIPLRLKRTYDGPNRAVFNGGTTLAELKSKVEKQNSQAESYSAEIFHDKYLLIKKSKDGTNNYYMIWDLLGQKSHTSDKINSDSDSRYLFWGMKIRADGGNIMVPYHMLPELDINNVLAYDSMQLNKEYATQYTIDDFYNFYSFINRFTVTKTDNTLSVKHDTRYLVWTFGSNGSVSLDIKLSDG